MSSDLQFLASLLKSRNTVDGEERLIAEIPLGRVGLPEDVADVIVFLASEQARWLTGQLLFVGGGHRMI